MSNDLDYPPTLEALAPAAPPALPENFCADLNHKLRTPLNAIIGFAELAALEAGGSHRAADLQQILKSAREMLHIIETELGQSPRPPATREMRVVKEPACDVLYVEDDIVNFTLVERILEFRPGLRIVHAPTGQRGIDLAGTCQPKLVLLDLNLPDMHGSEVLRILQRNTETTQIPVVVLSADATPSQIERLLTAGAKNYLTKPFDIDPFLTVVDEYLAMNRRAA